jgi:hypothetical protein
VFIDAFSHFVRNHYQPPVYRPSFDSPIGTKPLGSITFKLTIAMKTAATSILTAFAFVISLTSFSQATLPIDPAKPAETYATSFYTAVDGRLVLSLKKDVGPVVSIRLNQADGATLFTQQVTKRQTNTQVRFDMSQLPDGDYTVEVSDGARVTKHQVQLNTPQVASRQIAFK